MRQEQALGWTGLCLTIGMGCGEARSVPTIDGMIDAGSASSDGAAGGSAADGSPPGHHDTPHDAGGVPSPAHDAGADAKADDARPCNGAEIACDDFEALSSGAAVGGPWGYTGAPERAPTVDDSRAVSGQLSVAFASADTRGAFLYPASGLPTADNVLHARAYVQFEKATADMGGHVAFLVFATKPENGVELRLGASRNFHSQQMMLDLNFIGAGNELTQFSNGDVTGGEGSDAVGVALSANTWYCVEVAVDGVANSVRVWLDGAEVAGLHVTDWQGERTAPWLPTIEFVKFGVHNYSGAIGPAWYDDLAVGTTFIGCD